MFSSHQKITKDSGVSATDLEESVAKALLLIQTSQNSDIKGELRDILISGAKKIEGRSGQSAVVVFFPYRVWKHVKKIHSRLIRELEKKLSEKRHVVFVANRTIMGKNFRRKGLQVRPRSRTLTSVHDSILEDIVGPTEIVGRRTRISADGAKLIKIFLDPKDKDITEEKLGTFASVYKTLTNKDVVFSYPEHH